MDTQQFKRFAPTIRNLTTEELAGAPSLYEKLCIEANDKLRICYAPFEYINPSARVVIVGITPGRQQMINALREARRQLDLGSSDAQTLKAAKAVGAFSGDIRIHLVNLLDYVGIHHWLGITSSSELFGSAAHLVQTTSALRNPVFYQGKDYNGTPRMTRNPILCEQLRTHFAQDAKALPNAVFVPLGSKVTEALQFLADEGHLSKQQILDGLPHPSPQNIERIRYFLGLKSKAEVSVKTNPASLDAARASILGKVQALTH